MFFPTEYRPLVSIIIPVKNGEKTLPICLNAIKRSYYKNCEVIVVDDHSTDGTVGIARRFQCTVVEAEEGKGANSARNLGACSAKGEILVFMDSDVVVERETILGIIETMEEEHIDAVVGIYTAKHRHETFVSQYKNLWIRYSYIKSPPSIDWLFGAISGIRRSAFEKIGGFNVDLLARHGHDDIELGKRFAQAKLHIVLNMDVEVEHLKNYTLCSFIKNEYHRSVGFAELATKLGETKNSLRKGFVNVYPAFVVSTLFPVVFITIALGIAMGWFNPWSLAGAGGVYLVMNIRFLNYLEQVRGFFAMIMMVPLLFLDHIVCLIGSGVGVVRGVFRKKSG